MKAIIDNLIGNAYAIYVENQIYDVVFWKKASSLAKTKPTIKDTFEAMPCEILYPERKALTEKKLSSVLSKKIDWVDRKRSLEEIVSIGINSSIIEIQQFKYSTKKGGFEELENPKIRYIFKVDKFELIVSKAIFYHFASKPSIRAKRAV
jgi:hypothetical protein